MSLLIKKIFNFWFKLKQPIRFVLVGGYNTLVGYMLFVLFNYYLEHYLPYLTILLISYIIGIFNNFVLFKIFVFQTKGNWFKECIKTYYSYIFIYIINALFLYIFVSFLQFNTYFAQGICVVIMPFITYFILKFFSFKQKLIK